MPELFKDLKVISAYSNAIKTVTLIRTAMTVGIIAYCVLKTVQYLKTPNSSKQLTEFTGKLLK